MMLDLLNKSRCYGKFRLPLEVLIEQPDAAKQLFGQMLIVRAEALLYIPACVEYVAFSEMFDPVPMDCREPNYQMTYNGIVWRASRLPY